MICWSCREATSSAVCVGCGTIQPPPARPELFSILSLEASFFLDVKALEEAHRALSKKVHPDRFVKRSAVERRMSLQWTAAANEAKRVLKDPVTRARYLATGSSRPKEVGGPQLGSDFLELIFELQMEQDDSPDLVAQKAQRLYDQHYSELELEFKTWSSLGSEQKELASARVEMILAKLKYLGNLF
ncbi:MAG: hypothetical protein CMK59_01010 [Proteobacteria bacterium]|nr:hypothetical protein [Pseudomonadota bacterium]